jgi:hypothetical protein
MENIAKQFDEPAAKDWNYDRTPNQHFRVFDKLPKEPESERVELKPGEHHLKVIFRDTRLTVAAWLIALGVWALVALAVWRG